MGRHSVPGQEDEADALTALGGAEEESGSGGRHARAADADAAATTADEDVCRAGAREPGAGRSASPRGTAADVRLLRADRRLRVRALAAILVPFLLYLLLMTAIGRTDRLLAFLWTPIVLAGVLFGAVLDRGHRRAVAAPPTSPSGPAS